MCQAQRCVVIELSVLAMPSSSPAFHGGAGLRLAAAIIAAGSAANAAIPRLHDKMAASACALTRRGTEIRFIELALHAAVVGRARACSADRRTTRSQRGPRSRAAHRPCRDGRVRRAQASGALL